MGFLLSGWLYARIPCLSFFLHILLYALMMLYFNTLLTRDVSIRFQRVIQLTSLSVGVRD